MNNLDCIFNTNHISLSDQDDSMLYSNQNRSLNDKQLANMDFSILSNISILFIKRIKALRDVRELFCSNEYPESFTGQEAISVLCSILNEKIPKAYCIKIANALMNNRPSLFQPIHYSQISLINNTVYDSPDEIYNLNEDETNDSIPKGVLTCLTKCYTYGCQAEGNGCYVPMCPNKPAIFKYEFLTKSSISRQRTKPITFISKETSYSHKTWSEHVSKTLLESMTQRERDRQEAINEIIYSEQVYHNDLNTLHELVVVPLLNSKSIFMNSKKRKEFVNQVFNNYNELRDISSSLSNDLFQLQKSYDQKCIPSIGDVMIQHIRFFEKPFTTYCPHVPLSEYFLTNERESNSYLDQFLNQVSKEDRFRRLSFRHFLLNPVTRMQRYKLLLSAVLKKTDQDHSDYTYLIRCIDIINEVAKKSDCATMNFEKRIEILRINDSLIFKQDKIYDLQLDHTHQRRRLYHKGELKRKLNITLEHLQQNKNNNINNINNNNNNNKSDIYAFVFDHILLLTKLLPSTTITDRQVYRVWEPIPMQMISIEDSYDLNDKDNDDDLKTRYTLTNGLNECKLPQKPYDKNIYSLVLKHLDQPKKLYTFYFHSLEEKITWVKAIKKAKTALKSRQNEKYLFELRILDDPFFKCPIVADGFL
ncbi:unnamed protein product [Cunninghamella blakesleeana]